MPVLAVTPDKAREMMNMLAEKITRYIAQVVHGVHLHSLWDLHSCVALKQWMAHRAYGQVRAKK
jgi:hypothetical protein